MLRAGLWARVRRIQRKKQEVNRININGTVRGGKKRLLKKNDSA